MSRRPITMENVGTARVERWEPPEPVEDEFAPPVEPQWDGTCTSLPVARNIVRGGYGPNGEALDPKVYGRGERVEFRACLRDGRWIGPEGKHVARLFALGVIAGTPEAARMDREIQAVETERGAWDDEEPRLDMRPLSKAGLVEVLERGSRGSSSSLRARQEREALERGDSLLSLGAHQALMEEVGKGNGHPAPSAAELAEMARAAAEREAQEGK